MKKKKKKKKKKKNQYNAQYCSLNIYNITLCIPMCFDPQGTILGEKNKAIQYKIKLATFIHILHGVKELHSKM